MREHRLTAQRKASEEIARQIEEFERNGGVINRVENGATGTTGGLNSFVTAADRKRASKGAKNSPRRRNFN